MSPRPTQPLLRQKISYSAVNHRFKASLANPRAVLITIRGLHRKKIPSRVSRTCPHPVPVACDTIARSGPHCPVHCESPQLRYCILRLLGTERVLAYTVRCAAYRGPRYSQVQHSMIWSPSCARIIRGLTLPPFELNVPWPRSIRLCERGTGVALVSLCICR